MTTPTVTAIQVVMGVIPSGNATGTTRGEFFACVGRRGRGGGIVNAVGDEGEGIVRCGGAVWGGSGSSSRVGGPGRVAVAGGSGTVYSISRATTTEAEGIVVDGGVTGERICGVAGVISTDIGRGAMCDTVSASVRRGSAAWKSSGGARGEEASCLGPRGGSGGGVNIAGSESSLSECAVLEIGTCGCCNADTLRGGRAGGRTSFVDIVEDTGRCEGLNKRRCRRRS
jgi:hypothetical protein